METLKSYNPATGEVVGEVPVTPASDIPAVVARARAAQPAWEELGLEGRVDLLRKTAEIFAERAEAHGELMTKEMGKPLKEGIGEAKSLAYIDHELDEIVATLQPEVVEDKRLRSTVYHDPLGVVGAITPWNFPMSMPAWMVLPALAAGNTVVFKPSEETPLCGQAYADVLNEVLPEDVLIVVHGADDQGKAIVQSEVDMIAFTGSREVGKHILRESSGTLKRVVLELGGKDPMIVLEDADIGRAAKFAARNSFGNAGQVCVSVQRVFAHRSIARELAERLAQAAMALSVGDPTSPDTEVGPLIRPTEVERVGEWVKEAVDQGGELLTGGEALSETCYAPTVLYDPPGDAQVSVLEIFGPVVCVYPYDEVDEAIARSNSLPYAFQASVFTRDLDTALRASRRLDASAVMVNDHPAFRVDWMPFAGLRESGIGVGGIPYTMQDMQIKKLVVIRSKEL